MGKKSFLAISIGAAVFGLTSSAFASPVISWDFKAYGGFAKLHSGDFPNPGYNVLLTPLPPREHQDMGAFHWSTLARPSLLGINQKEPLIHGQSWKAPGRYYGEKNPIQPGITSIHGEPIGPIVTGDDMGEVIGWTTHYNNWIPDGFEGGRVAVNYHVQLFEPGVEAPAWDSGEMFFFMDVFETNNNLECCPDGNYNPAPHDDGCADRFRVGLLEDFNGNDVIDPNDLEMAPEPGACFDALVGSFSYSSEELDVNYNVYLTGFWEAGEPPEQKGEGWSKENEFIHFEVRAEVWDAAITREAKQCSPNPPYPSCEPD
jgi:hypothetical protein